LNTANDLARTGYNVMWPAWDVLQSRLYCVFINLSELYWIATISQYCNAGCVIFCRFVKCCDVTESFNFMLFNSENNEASSHKFGGVWGL
jgi:hypothetical protein